VTAPKLVTVAIIEKDNKILLIKRAREPFKNCWAFVGGINIMNDSNLSNPLEAVKNEVRFDLDCEFSPNFFNYYYEKLEEPKITFFFYGDIRGEVKIASEQVLEFRWFTFDEAMELNLAFDNKKMLLEYINKKQERGTL